jgi:predicted outer membrane protein
MKKLMLLPGLFAFSFLFLVGCNQQQEATEQAEDVNEERFEDDMEDIAEEVTELYGVNQMILEVAQNAQGNTILSQEILSFNDQVLNDHQQVKDKLTQLANEKNIALPENINYGEGSEVNDLMTTDPDDYADKYIDIISQASDDMERKLEDLADELEGSYPEISSFVQNTITTVRAHEQSVDEVDEEI